MCWWFSESINLEGQPSTVYKADRTYALQVFEGVQFWTETTMDAEELLVHNGRQRQ